MCNSIVSPSSSKITAAVPPSAETECERMTWTFEITPIFIFEFFFAASMAARRPAKPEPQIMRSYSIDSDIIRHLTSENRLNMYCKKKISKIMPNH